MLVRAPKVHESTNIHPDRAIAQLKLLCWLVRRKAYIFILISEQLGDTGSAHETPFSCAQLKLLYWLARRELIKGITFTNNLATANLPDIYLYG